MGDIVPHIDESDISQTIKELNNDTPDEKTNMSGIDMRARLNVSEIPQILAIDTLVLLGVLPRELTQLTRQKKRLSVSKGGIGRSEIVKIAVGRQEDEREKRGINPRSPIGLFRKESGGD